MHCSLPSSNIPTLKMIKVHVTHARHLNLAQSWCFKEESKCSEQHASNGGYSSMFRMSRGLDKSWASQKRRCYLATLLSRYPQHQRRRKCSSPSCSQWQACSNRPQSAWHALPYCGTTTCESKRSMHCRSQKLADIRVTFNLSNLSCERILLGDVSIWLDFTSAFRVIWNKFVRLWILWVVFE